MNTRRYALAGVLLLLSSPPAAYAGYVPRAEVEAAARAAAIEAKQWTDESALTGALQQAQWRSAADPLIHEAQMMSTLLRLRDVTAPAAQTRAAVSALLDYPTLTFTDPVDVEQRGRQVPAFAVAGAARAALSHWQQRSDVAQLRSALTQADHAGIAGSDNPLAIAEVIGTASASELELLRDSLAATPANLHALFLRLAEPQLALSALQQAPSVEGHGLIGDVARVLAPDAAFAVLGDVSIQADYRSAARIAIAPLVAQLPAAREFLLADLAGESGASSAVALGRSGDAAALAALVHIVASERDTPRLRHTLLGLRASQDAAARAALTRFVADQTRSAALREEVGVWLR